MAQKDIGNKKPLHELKTTNEVMLYYDEWSKGNKYKGNRMLNWCPISKSAISDAEVNHKALTYAHLPLTTKREE